MFWTGLAIGLVVGSTLGVVLMACCAVAGRADEQMECALRGDVCEN